MAYSPDFRANPPFAGGAAQAAVLDQGLRAYMLRVYNWMASGLLLTAIVAFAVAETSLRDAFYHQVQGNFGQMVMRPTGLATLCMIAPLGFVLVLSFGINRLSRGTAQALYWAFCGVMGASISNIFLVYEHSSIASTFLVAASMFAAMSIWGYTTNRDLSRMGSFLMMGLFGIIIASVVNILFLHAAGMQFAISIIGVVVFTGLTAWDTQRIKASYLNFAYAEGPDAAAKRSVYDALNLYLNFINLFMMLLQLTGNRNSNS
jgi:FtsH-binding integral membrane protein